MKFYKDIGFHIQQENIMNYSYKKGGNGKRQKNKQTKKKKTRKNINKKKKTRQKR